MRNHSVKKEIWLIIYKKVSGKKGIPYEEAVEEALCWGWIDGQMKSLDVDRYSNRFSPRRRKSQWSDSNITRVKGLIAAGRMTKAGLAVIPPNLLKKRSGI